MQEKKHLAWDLVMPFDFLTMRKVNLYYGQSVPPLSVLMQDKEGALELVKA